MSLLRADNPGRLYLERPIWIGQVARGEWAAFIISTPVMFYAAGVSWNPILIHVEAFKSLSRTSIGDRYRNFGSFGDQEVKHRGQLVFFVLGV
jgi:hypothetical protein